MEYISGFQAESSYLTSKNIAERVENKKEMCNFFFNLHNLLIYKLTIKAVHNNIFQVLYVCPTLFFLISRCFMFYNSTKTTALTVPM